MMNKNVKLLFLIAGIITIAYGIHMLEIQKVKDNTNSYITIAIGFVFLIISFLKGKS